MWRRWMLLCGLGLHLLVGSTAVSAEGESDGTALTLERALLLALEQNAEIRNAEQRIERQQNVVLEARAFLYPSVDLRASTEVIDKDLLAALDGDQFGSNKSWDAAAEVSQALYAGGRSSAYYEQQKLLEKAAELELKEVVLSTILGIRERFYDVLLSRAELRVREQSVTLNEQALSEEQERFKAGTVSQFNVLRAEVELANAKTPLIRARNRVTLTVEELIRAIGVPESELRTAYDVEGQLAFVPQALVLDDLLGIAIKDRPQLARLQLLLDAADRGVRVEWGRYLPTITARAAYGAQKDQFSDSYSDSLSGWRVGADASWNIFEGFATEAKVEQAKADVSLARINLKQARHDVDVEVRRTFSTVRESENLVKASQKVVEQAEESLRLANQRYAAGVSTQLEVLDAQVALTDARSNEVRAVYEHNIAIARLEKSIGRLALP